MYDSFSYDDVSNNDLFYLPDSAAFLLGSSDLRLSNGSELGSTYEGTFTEYYDQEVIPRLDSIYSLLGVLVFVTLCNFLVPMVKGIFRKLMGRSSNG